MNFYYDEMDSPVGMLTIMTDGEKAIRIDYGPFAELEASMQKWAKRYFEHPAFIQNSEQVDHVKSELLDYFQGKRQDFSFAFAFHGTPFQQKVWHALYDAIPYGQTRTYKDIAEVIGKPKAIRAVGGAVNKNPFSIVVPCHRVIGSNGKMVGYGGGVDKKEFLLAHEAK
ncbi:methylated-DNA--[protein]-cysteine S-methyltransferase [Lentibacillus salinarum]|uniref:Methylated-DNA--protein-cysteine methyltransferase n=1 Tax=Lentibacillus salinarum TaxID=446820 RepID=A0ABW3ZSU7_9BACI